MTNRSPEEKKLDKLLLKAAAAGDVAQIEKLLDEGADIETRTNSLIGMGRTPLHKASVKGHEKAVEFLLLKGAKIDPESELYKTPLLEAVENKKASMVKLLLKHGANTQARNYEGRNALSLAMFNRTAEIVDILRRHEDEKTLKESLARRRAQAELRARKLAEPKTPEMPDTVTVFHKLGDRVLQEIFNFAGRERITLIRKEKDGPIEGMVRQNFSEIDDKTCIRAAFAQYAQNGGKIPEEEIFTQALDKPVLEKPNLDRPGIPPAPKGGGK